jgi:hypothetical protein
MLIWSARHEQTEAPCAVIDHMQNNRAAILAETFRRWEQRDPTPILPPFRSPAQTAENQSSKLNGRKFPKGNPKR